MIPKSQQQQDLERRLQQRREAVVASAREDSEFWKRSRRDFAIAASELYFPNQEPGRKHDIQNTIYDVLYSVEDAVRATRSVTRILKLIRDDLDYLRTAFEPGRRPRRARAISGMTVSLIGGVMPRGLQAVATGSGSHDGLGDTFGDLPSNDGGQDAVDQPEFILAPMSGLLAGVLAHYSATDRLVAIAPYDQTWPPCLAALGFETRGEITQSVLMEQILALAQEHRHDLRIGAERAQGILKRQFGIQSPNDPMRINPAHFGYERPSATLMRYLCELVAPFRVCMDASHYEFLLFHDRYEGLYVACVNHLRHCFARDMDAQAVSDLFRSAGLLALDPLEHDETVRFVRRMIAVHRQIALLHKARQRIEHLLSEVCGAELETYAAVPTYPDFTVSWSDFHDLGRWMDALHGRLRLGLVDPGRVPRSRIPLPDVQTPEFPSAARAGEGADALLKRLVTATRVAREQGE